MKSIEITIEKRTYTTKTNTSILEFIHLFFPKENDEILAAFVNNRAVSLNYLLNENDTELEFIKIQHPIGSLIYKRSVSFLVHRAVFELFRNSRIVQGTSLGNSYYYDFYTDIPVNEPLLKEIALKIREYINNKEPFEHFTLSKEEAVEYFKKRGFFNKMNLVLQQETPFISIYSSAHYKDIDFGPLIPHAGYVKDFWLKRYSRGFLIYFTPEHEKETHLIQLGKKANLFKAFTESKNWGQIVEVNNVRRLNEVVLNGNIQELVNICEGLHEKKIAHVADRVNDSQKRQSTRLILIAGPSSSGKTTFTRRLAVHLKVNGLNPVFVSLDNYYIDREKTPKDKFGNYDFENILAIDLPLLNAHLNELLHGNEIAMPIYDFETGKRKENTVPLRIDEYQPIILEGIHALNPLLTEKIIEDLKFKIYVSALTPLAIDDFNRISSSDNRLLRRLVRDHKFRGYSAEQTLRQWISVREGEEKYVFPYQERAHVFFNSAHHFELPVLKKQAENLLTEISSDKREFRVANHLLNLLSLFKNIDERYIPQNSILREFLGDSCFKY